MAEDFSDLEREILRARTRALAAPPPSAEHHEVIDVIYVSVSGERYGVEVAAVLGVAPLERITPLPHPPEHVAGLVAYQGEVLAAFYLRALLELPLSTLPEHGRVLLVGRTGVELALVVDTVERTARISRHQLSEAPDSISERAGALLTGIDPGGLPVLGADALLSSSRLFVDIETAVRKP